MTIYSPNNIEVLLHYFLDPAAHPRIEAPAVRDATNMLLREGCIERWPEGAIARYRTTPLGAAWVKALCNAELPRAVYIDAQGNILE